MSLVQRVQKHIDLVGRTKQTLPPVSHSTIEEWEAQHGFALPSAFTDQLIQRYLAFTEAEQAKKILPPASLSAVHALEARLGFALPALLTDILTQVSNGGFGPCFGILGVSLDNTDASYEEIGDEECLGAHYLASHTEEALTESPFPLWPEKLLPFCHWGCGIYSCLDCSLPQAPVITFDCNIVTNNGDDHVFCFMPHHPSFADWIEAWLDNVDLWAEIHQSTLDYCSAREDLR